MTNNYAKIVLWSMPTPESPQMKATTHVKFFDQKNTQSVNDALGWLDMMTRSHRKARPSTYYHVPGSRYLYVEDRP